MNKLHKTQYMLKIIRNTHLKSFEQNQSSKLIKETSTLMKSPEVT